MANRLAAESSAYLRQHAENPVDWWPWGEPALAAARRLDRPILLSVGYSACHWCHVMAHESFADPAIAALMNDGFVCVKVDREERPDLDRLYQGVVQLSAHGGGWPLTVFFAPDLRPFFGGTYFPPEDRFGMPGLPRVLSAVLDAWRHRREELLASAEGFTDGLRGLMGAGLQGEPGELSASDLSRAGERLLEALDPDLGGFGGAPKFPNPAALDLLLRAWRRTRAQPLLDGALTTLERMAEGGVFDQLGGGFHRYSVAAAWRVPHFEKMLYDNAQLLRLYAQAHQARPGSLGEQVVADTVGWLSREMTSPEGAFYSSQDADSEGEEGRFFVWSPAQIEAVAGPELAPLLCRRFGVSQRGNFEGGRTVLRIAEPVEAIARAARADPVRLESQLARGRALLFQAREGRPRPGRDEKVLAGWNGLAIGALAVASRALQRPDWAALASRAADFVVGKLWRSGRLARIFALGQARGDGLLEDYGDLAEGLVQLYMATFEERFLEAAAQLADRAVALFWDEPAQAFLAAPRDGERLLVPVFSVHDDAWPSGASTLCEALIALGALTADARRLEVPRRYFKRLHGPMRDNPLAFGRRWCAADALRDGAPSLLVGGERAAAGDLVREANQRYAPTLALSRQEPGGPTSPLLRGAFEGKLAPPGSAAAWLCRAFSCELPALSPGELGSRLQPLFP